MSEFRELLLKLPKELLNEVERISADMQITTEEVVNKSLKLYIKRHNDLKKGYEEMAKLNQEYAEMCLKADNEALEACEEKLSESENSDC